jgi:hypothetical protein
MISRDKGGNVGKESADVGFSRFGSGPGAFSDERETTLRSVPCATVPPIHAYLALDI